MFEKLLGRKTTIGNRRCTDNPQCACGGVTDLVVKSALELSKDIEEKARQISTQLRKLEESRIGGHH